MMHAYRRPWMLRALFCVFVSTSFVFARETAPPATNSAKTEATQKDAADEVREESDGSRRRPYLSTDVRTSRQRSSKEPRKISVWPQTPYRYFIPRRSRRPLRLRYYAPAFRYPPGVYPRTAGMMYYGPAVRVYQSPWGYAR